MSLALGGCSVGVPGFGDDAPAITGSVPDKPEVERPLPPTLAYSDAAKIGEAAFVALWQAEGEGSADWLNASTGSSGTVERRMAEAADAEGCRAFETLVTSIGGVHRYSGRVCRGADGRPQVHIDPAGDNQPA
jgi:hypothetical protein